MDELENRLDHLEQYSRINTLEIKGIPLVPNEDVLSVVTEVGKALNMTISSWMIEACHNLKKSVDYDGIIDPPGIIVKFVRLGDKEDMLQKCRAMRNLSTRHMNRSDDIPVYINKSLASARMTLFAQARKLKRTISMFGYAMEKPSSGKTIKKKLLLVLARLTSVSCSLFLAKLPGCIQQINAFVLTLLLYH